jgi:hypothetical protein
MNPDHLAGVDQYFNTRPEPISVLNEAILGSYPVDGVEH